MSVHDARVLAFLVWLPTTEDPHEVWLLVPVRAPRADERTL